jgi:AAHS family 4-hydroxybenzoate transporter-like MFS transporter
MNASTTLDIRAFIDGRRMSANQWTLVVLCFLIVAMDGMDVAIMVSLHPRSSPTGTLRNRRSVS